MPFVRSLSPWAITALLCIGTVRGEPMNYTLDDTSPGVIYTQPPLDRCSPGVCDANWTAKLHNGTSTLTDRPIIIPFVGSAVYVYLGMIGNCTFNLDGIDVGEFTNDDPGLADDIYPAFKNTSMPDTAHVLMVYPQKPDWIIQFDYLVYTHNPRKASRRGAIIGGVVGGVAAAAIVSVGAFLFRRRRQQRRLSTRGIPLGDHWPDKPSLKLGGIGEPK